jgi:hypothetical protein
MVENQQCQFITYDVKGNKKKEKIVRNNKDKRN